MVLFVITAVVIVRFTPVKEFLTAERLGNFLENAGFLAPLAYMIVYAAGSGNTMRPSSETALPQYFTCALSTSRLPP